MNKKQLWLYMELWLAMPHYKAESHVRPPSIGFQSAKKLTIHRPQGGIQRNLRSLLGVLD